MELRTAAHTTYSIYYHIVFIPKYRRKIFNHQNIDNLVKKVVQDRAPYHSWIIEQLETDEDHLHLFLSTPPRYSPAEIVKLIKTWTYHNVYDKVPEIKQYLWGGKLWCEGYFITTVNDATTNDMIKRYVQNQKAHFKQLKLW